MTDSGPFIDLYTVLQVRPDCSAKALETAYRFLAKKYHPDHPETADVNKFNDVMGAYRVLRSPEKRAEYNLSYAEHTPGAAFEFLAEANVEADEKSVLSDSDAHTRILLLLYQRRRDNAKDAGVVRFYIQEMLNCTDENFEFHIWYLKSKGFIEATEYGTLAITIEGVDQVISLSRTASTEKLRIAQSNGVED